VVIAGGIVAAVDDFFGNFRKAFPQSVARFDFQLAGRVFGMGFHGCALPVNGLGAVVMFERPEWEKLYQPAGLVKKLDGFGEPDTIALPPKYFIDLGQTIG
jgi:hypothetical protein